MASTLHSPSTLDSSPVSGSVATWISGSNQIVLAPRKDGLPCSLLRREDAGRSMRIPVKVRSSGFVNLTCPKSCWRRLGTFSDFSNLTVRFCRSWW